MKCTKTIVNKS